MKELQEILKKISQFAPNEKAILATVVDVVGSGYRRPGARMLIDSEGKSIGTVSGGCLEADVLERAKKVLRTNEPSVITYDTTNDENSVFGLGMGCRGIVRILLESIEKESFFIKVLRSIFDNRKKQIAATLISTDENLPIGGRVFYDESGKFISKNLPVFLESFSHLRRDCQDFFNENARETSRVQTYETETGTLEFFIEKINPPLSFLLFGAGYDALPLADFAKNLGWKLTVIDHRAAFVSEKRFPEADEIIVSRPENLCDNLFADENSAAVVMTHNYDRDREILRRLLHSKCRYIGALGPKKRAAKLLEEIGETFSKEQLEKLYAPVGLDIGASAPEEIALAIIAEIKSVMVNRGGGFLRDRQGSIYGQNE
ncbi:MAG: XdhC family protein [Pyrinomonadaceae bacterium]